MRKLIAALLIMCLLTAIFSFAVGEQGQKAPENIFGFDMTREEFMEALITLLDQQKDWTEKTAPQTLDEVPLFPNVMDELGKALDKKVYAKLKVKGSTYTCVSNLEDLFTEAGYDFRPGRMSLALGFEQENGGVGSMSMTNVDDFTYQVEFTKEELKELAESVGENYKKWKIGVCAIQVFPWWEGNIKFFVQAEKTMKKYKQGWVPVLQFQLEWGQNAICWGYDYKKNTYLFNVRDKPDQMGCILFYSGKTGKLTLFQRGGNSLVTVTVR